MTKTKKTSTNSNRKYITGRHLIAALMAGTALLSTPFQAEARAAQKINHPQPVQKVDFNIKPQKLSKALILFAKQSGLQVSLNASLVRDLSTVGIVGSYEPLKALGILLSGTKLFHQTSSASTIIIHSAAATRILETPSAVVNLDAIIITGEKVDRPYVETTTSVGVATESDIEDYNFQNLQDSFNSMANVRSFAGSDGNRGFQIRGINSEGVTQPATAPPVISVIIDGATQSKEGLIRGSRGTWDVGQIEVLRGPQSTLQGRNALAGAVVIKTNDPTYYPEFAFKGEIGELEKKGVAFAVSGPLIADQLAVRLSGEFRKERKDVNFADTAKDPLADDEFRNLRAKVLIEPKGIKGLSLLFTASRTFDKTPTFVVSGPDFSARNVSGSSLFTEFREMDVKNYISDASFAFNDWLKVHSLSALNKTDLAISSAPSSAASFVRADNRKDDDFTQDTRVEITQNPSGITGTVGTFYGDFKQHIDTVIRADLGAGFIQDAQVGTIDSKTKTMAVYADLRYKITDNWTLIGGMRYQKDIVRNAANVVSLAFGNNIYSVKSKFNVFLPKFGISYALNANQTIAATASRGYRQGFAETIVGTTQINLVNPEYVWTYEVSYRATSPDGNLTFGANAFYNQYTDQQITTENPAFAPLTNTFNTGNSVSYGAEFEGRYDFGNGLNMFGALGLLKTEFKDFEDVACAPSGGSCSGNEYPEAPSVTASIGGIYNHASGAFISANANYTGAYFSSGEINNRSQFEIKHRIIANTKFGYEYKNLKASVFVDNIFDKQYITAISSNLTEAGIGEGRTIGAEMLVKF